MIEEIRKRNEERREKGRAFSSEIGKQRPRTPSLVRLANDYYSAYTDINTLLRMVDEIDKWIDNPNYNHVERLHRIEVVIRGYVKGKEVGK